MPAAQAPTIEAPPTQRPRREVEPIADRVLVIGLDGATFDILNPMMGAGMMPRLREIIATGASGILDSTKPPITPAAWTTFMTGKGPGRHGIVDFEKYDVFNNSLSFNSTFEIRVKTIWEILSDKGFRVGSINLPMTYPPKKVNGFLISGFETPSTDVEFTYPYELKQEILRRWPQYSVGTRWKRKAVGGNDIFAENVDYIARSFDQGCEIAQYCGTRYGWDVMMVLFKLVDNLQHKAWRYLDPRTAGEHPNRSRLAANCFAELDCVIGKLVGYAQEHNATVIMMSDHGHGSLDGKAQANHLLHKWGYLSLQSPLTRAAMRGRRILDRLTRKQAGRFHVHNGWERDLVIDWPRTRACVVHAGIYGFMYLNLRGRQPQGIVEPVEYERLRDEIREKFLAAETRNPAGERIRIFPEVHKPEELYRCDRAGNEWMPDLLLVPQPGLAVVRKIRGAAPVKWASPRRLEGTHRVEGIIIAHGPHVRRGARIHGNIVDIAPTLLSMVGLRVPIDMEGRVLAELFDRPPVVEHEPPQVKDHQAPQAEVYTEEEKERLNRRLSDLGYLE